MALDCLFCQLVQGQLPAHIVWSSESHMAFLTPFPNTPGFTVVIPKDHHDSYGFAVEEKTYLELMQAAREVAGLIDKNLGVTRTGLIMEGFGINHLHVKLFPMHGINQKEWQPILSDDKTFYLTYPGMIASNDGPRMPDEQLASIARQIRGESADV